MKQNISLIIILIFTSACGDGRGSPCPQTRRADATDNRKFYYCINLPTSSIGHVWIPAQCNYGLVFQSTLGMCVLNQTSACLNGLDNTCYFIQNNTFTEAVETPNTAPDLAEILALNFNSGNFKVSTTPRNYSEVQASTKPLLNPSIITNNFKEQQQKLTTNPTIIAMDKIKVPQNNSKENLYVSANYEIPLKPASTVSPSQDTPCTTGVRMPNLIDCTKYYICNSTPNTVQEFSCPPHTAFNPFKHACEAQAYILCHGQSHPKNKPAALILSQTTITTATSTENEPNVCDKPGRTADPQSNHHYYYCFHLSGNLIEHRLPCPTGLYYCPMLKTCETESKCPTYR